MSSEALAILITIYFPPTLVGCVRVRADGMFCVVMVNLFLGWTVLGWLGAFVWACSGRTEGDIRHEKRQHADLPAALKQQHADLVVRAAMVTTLKTIIWAALAVALLKDRPVHAQSTTQCHRFGHGTVCGLATITAARCSGPTATVLNPNPETSVISAEV